MLRNKNVLITGCNRGIGLSIMRLLAEHGANIWACCRTINDAFLEDISELERIYDVSIKAIQVELTDSILLARTLDAIIAEKRSIDILINNAGITATALLQQTSMEEIRKVFDKEAKDIRVFDKDIFEALIYKVVIGDYDSNGNKDPYVIRFIVKSGIENVKDKIESKVIENILNKENLILDFYSWQNYVSFEKQADGSLRKKLETKIRVKVELNSDNTTQ